MLGATLAFEPDVISKFRQLTARSLTSGLDTVLPLRAAALKGFYYIAEPLVLYRHHYTNMGNFIADQTGSQLAYKETHLAHEMAARLRALDDLLDLKLVRPDDARLSTLCTKLEARLIDDLRTWAGLRGELRAGAKLPTWIDETTMRVRYLRPRLSWWLEKFGRLPLFARLKHRTIRFLSLHED